MNKTDLINAIAYKTKLSKSDSANVINGFIEILSNTLKKGEKLTLIGFGNFEVVRRAGKKCRHPKTGEIIHIKPLKVPKFKAGKELKKLVNK